MIAQLKSTVRATSVRPPRRVVTASLTPGSKCFSQLPGDPSLVLHTSVKMDKEKKMKFMKECSALIAATYSKPESYVAVCVVDGQDLIWAGSETPCALGTLSSIGGINQANNKTFSQGLHDLLAPFGITGDRYYVSFFDMPRENIAWNGATFAG